MTKDFLPKGDKELNEWGQNFVQVLAKIMKRIEFPEEAYDELVMLQNLFSQRLFLADAPETRTKATIREKNEAHKYLDKSIRQATAEHLTYNRMVSNSDRENLGLPVHKTSRTRAPVASTYPWVHVLSDTIRHITINYGSSETSKAKPEGQHGVELVWEIAQEKPAHMYKLTHSVFDTHSPVVLEFDEEDRGKTLFFALRWENTRGEKGPWTEIMHVVIP
jgi:hypothetical protein